LLIGFKRRKSNAGVVPGDVFRKNRSHARLPVSREHDCREDVRREHEITGAATRLLLLRRRFQVAPALKAKNR
jgi:hypothetical protein